MSIDWRPRPGDWLLNKSILDDAVRAMQRQRKVDTTHDIPYVAGYSKNGKTLYVDRSLPLTYKTPSGKTIDVMRYLLLHEEIEKALLEAFKLPYQFAHQIALRVEQDAVKADGIDWSEYNSFFVVQIKRIGAKKNYSDVPADLDLQPYHDEDDTTTLKRMHT